MNLQKLVEPLQNRIMLMLSRGTLERTNDDGDYQTHQVSIYEGDVVEDLERIGQWGFASNPPAGSGVVCGFFGGHRSNGVILGVDERSRPRLPIGETAIWNNFDCEIRLLSDGSISITPGGTTVTINGNVHITGSVTIDGDLNGHAP